MQLLLGAGRIGRLLAVTALPLALLAVLAPTASASAGSLDTSFGDGGFATLSVGSSAGAAAVVVQSDGKIVTAGRATVNGTNEIVSTRMTPSGALDPTYGVGGIVTVNINGGAQVESGAALALQSDGKIVMVGSGNRTIYGPTSFAAVRLTASGAPDPSFGTGGVSTVSVGASAIANAVVIQPDGKLVLAGTALLSHKQFAAIRLNADGTLDTTFGIAGVSTLSPTGGVWGAALQGDGKIILAGQTDYNNPAIANAQQFTAARLNSDGTLDASYGQGGIVNVPVGGTSLGYGVALQSDGKAVIAGPAWTHTNVNAAVRLNLDGSIDRTYGTNGIAMVPDGYGANGILIDARGRVLLPAVGPSIVRFNPDGSVDQTFGTAGMAMAKLGAGGAANGAAAQTDGNIVLGGALSINGQVVIAVIRLYGDAGTPTATSSTSAAAGTTAAAGTPAAAGTTANRSTAAVRSSVRCSVRARSHSKRHMRHAAKRRHARRHRAAKRQRAAKRHHVAKRRLRPSRCR